MRDRILDAFEGLLVRRSFQTISLEDVAEAAGLGLEQIRAEFVSKRDLALAQLDRIHARAVEQLEVVAAMRKPALWRLHQILVLRVLLRCDAARPYAERLDEMVSEVRHAYLVARQRHFDREANLVRTLLSQFIDWDGTAFGETTAATARTLILATNALLPYELRTRELNDRAGVEHKAHSMARLLLRNLEVKSRRSEVGAASI